MLIEHSQVRDIPRNYHDVPSSEESEAPLLGFFAFLTPSFSNLQHRWRWG
jgi:hypothetical protein